MPTHAALVLDTVQSFLTLASLLFTALPMSYCRFDEDDDDDDDVMSVSYDLCKVNSIQKTF